MNDLRDLYAEVVMDHNRRPRNLKRIEGADRTAEGFNPLCGDQISLFVDLGEGESIEDIGYTAMGCAISKAAASMMSEAVKGRSLNDARRVVSEFRRLLTKDVGDDFDYDLLGDLEILEGVSNYPTRIKCATLPLHTLASALDDDKGAVSTE
jgi:nitrogen fixation NifU-like protein